MRSLAQRLFVVVLLAVGLSLTLAGCGGGDKAITIGTKFDQPGLAVKKPDGTMAGFDVDVATYVAGKLGYSPDQILREFFVFDEFHISKKGEIELELVPQGNLAERIRAAGAGIGARPVRSFQRARGARCKHQCQDPRMDGRASSWLWATQHLAAGGHLELCDVRAGTPIAHFRSRQDSWRS